MASVASSTITTVQVNSSDSEPQISPTPVKHKKIRRPKPPAEVIEAICRICHETVDPSDLGVVRACRCRNYLHQNCYQEWFKTAHTTNCEICLTNYKIKTRKILSKTQRKQNWCKFFNHILVAFLFVILTGVTYFTDLKYLVNPPTKTDFLGLNYMAMTLAFFGCIYWIDGVIGFNWQKIVQKDIRWRPWIFYVETDDTFYGFMNLQIHAIIHPITTAFSLYIGNSFLGVSMIIMILIVPFSLGMLNIFRIMFPLCVLVTIFLPWYCFCVLHRFKNTTMRQNIRKLLAIIGGQLLFQAIGMVILKTVSSNTILWLYMAKQSQPNVFTCAIGGLAWITGLIILFVLIRLVISFGRLVSWCCCPREILPQLEPYVGGSAP